MLSRMMLKDCSSLVKAISLRQTPTNAGNSLFHMITRVSKGYYKVLYILSNMSLVIRKLAFCICQNKGADRSNCVADLIYEG